MSHDPSEIVIIFLFLYSKTVFWLSVLQTVVLLNMIVETLKLFFRILLRM